jgi:bifunctional UDP-N-acetylglucosamine pyrophosphorylase/glucosamine-1-phosphate N-acetyltransferase
MRSHAAAAVDSSRWTALIPAAGRGSRLAFDKPKILYPLLGRPMLDWLLDCLDALCSRFVLVLSPEGRGQVEPHARARLGSRLEIAIQPEPRGMADAIELGVACVKTPNTLVVWGDQVTLRRETVLACAAKHEGRRGALLTLATCTKEDPYIDIVRDGDGRIVRVDQAREGEIKRRVGENDCGLFLFATDALKATLASARSRQPDLGRATGEFNLLSLLPLFEQGRGTVDTVHVTDLAETLGVNDRRDATLAEEVLRRRVASGTRPDH